MNCDVFDTYVTKSDGQMMHFDIIVPSGTAQETVFAFGQRYLASVSVNDGVISAERCRFCHVETATPEMVAAIKQQGFFILAMEGCPTIAPQTIKETIDE
ncbi:MAG: hypothetical protein DHS20C20_30700 [Ardenticatenaceae bacterium]|nr:MAG: hypothetical protein DHS20C20_30700 [Ardenticatenaceae bacterium]